MELLYLSQMACKSHVPISLPGPSVLVSMAAGLTPTLSRATHPNVISLPVYKGLTQP